MEIGQLPPQIHTPPPANTAEMLVDRLAESECPALTMRRARRSEEIGAPYDPIVWHAARDCNVVDVDGNRYVDMSAGFGAAAVGHGHPRVVAALAKQGSTLLHALGDLHPSDAKVHLLTRLAELAPFPEARVMLGLSGADAVEAALKTAVLATGRPGVLAFTGGYHGLATGVLPVCGYRDEFRAPFAEQSGQHVVFAPYPGADVAVESAMLAVTTALAEATVPVGAVLVEPVQGRAGVRVPPPEFLASLSELCRAQGMLLIADEVLTGLGRSGVRFLSVEAGAEPDLICLGKALGGGLPTSACLGRADVMAAWGEPGHEAIHTGTFLGNPLLSAAALATLEVLAEQRLADRARRMGTYLQSRLHELKGNFAQIRAVRGVGLLVGVEFGAPGYALKVVHALLGRGYITVPAGAQGEVLSLTPPLTMEQGLMDGFIEALSDSLADLGAAADSEAESEEAPVSTETAGEG